MSCKDCKRRSPTCHIGCVEYIRESRLTTEMNQKLGKERKLNSYLERQDFLREKARGVKK